MNATKSTNNKERAASCERRVTREYEFRLFTRNSKLTTRNFSEHDNGPYISRRQTAMGSAALSGFGHARSRARQTSPLAPCRRHASGSDWPPTTDEGRTV